MTSRDEQRAACIEAMKLAFIIARKFTAFADRQEFDRAMTDAFDSLHGIARVCPIEATEEMLYIGSCIVAAKSGGNSGNLPKAWAAMSAAGDLTNHPEEKP